MGFHHPSAEEVAAIRARLPRVPMRHSGLIPLEGLSPGQIFAEGMPRPKIEGVPIPATSLVTRDGRVSIIGSHPEDWREVIADRLCDLCAEELSSGKRAYVIGPVKGEHSEQVLIARGAMHKRCFSAASHWCPHLREGLLGETQRAGSLTIEELFDPQITRVAADEGQGPELSRPTVIAEYQIVLEALRPEWPFQSSRARD